MGRVFANGPGDRDSITGRVIPKTQKWYLTPLCLTRSIITPASWVKWSNPGKGVAPSITHRCRSEKRVFGSLYHCKIIWNTGNYTAVCKLFVLDRNSCYHITNKNSKEAVAQKMYKYRRITNAIPYPLDIKNPRGFIILLKSILRSIKHGPCKQFDLVPLNMNHGK